MDLTRTGSPPNGAFRSSKSSFLAAVMDIVIPRGLSRRLRAALWALAVV